MELSIRYTWHPFLPSDPLKSKRVTEKTNQKQSIKISKQKKIDSLSTDPGDTASLVPGSSDSKSSVNQGKFAPVVTFDPTTLDPDEIRVDFRLDPGSTLVLYGSLLHSILAIKVSMSLSMILPAHDVE